jgi:hypothetical protein
VEFAALPSPTAAKWTGDNGSTANVLVHALRAKGGGVEYLCVASDGRTYLLNASTVTFDKVPTGDPVRLGKVKGGAKKSR